MNIKIAGADQSTKVCGLPYGSVFRADGYYYLVIEHAELNGGGDVVLYAVTLDGLLWWTNGEWLVADEDVFNIDEVILSRRVK